MPVGRIRVHRVPALGGILPRAARLTEDVRTEDLETDDMPANTPPSTGGRGLFIATFVCSALTALVTLVFFVIGLGDGSVSSFNLPLWLGLLAIVSLSLWAGYALHARGRLGLAIAALSITAVPGVVGALFLLLLLVTRPRWN